MTENHDRSFETTRNDTFTRLIAAMEAKIAAVPVSLLLRFDETGIDASRNAALRECWSLLLRGVRHLHDGAPGGKAGMISEALSRASLRSSALAAALGVRPPKYEQLPFVAEYTTGHEAALFFCRRLGEAALADLGKSRSAIHRKIVDGTPADVLGVCASGQDIEAMRQQVIFAFNVTADLYEVACHEFTALVDGLPPPKPSRKKTPRPS